MIPPPPQSLSARNSEVASRLSLGCDLNKMQGDLAILLDSLPSLHDLSLMTDISSIPICLMRSRLRSRASICGSRMASGAVRRTWRTLRDIWLRRSPYYDFWERVRVDDEDEDDREYASLEEYEDCLQDEEWDEFGRPDDERLDDDDDSFRSRIPRALDERRGEPDGLTRNVASIFLIARRRGNHLAWPAL